MLLGLLAAALLGGGATVARADESRATLTGYLWQVTYSSCCGTNVALAVCGSGTEVCTPETWPKKEDLPLTEGTIYQSETAIVVVDGLEAGRLQPDGQLSVGDLAPGTHTLQFGDPAKGGGLTPPVTVTLSPGLNLLSVPALIRQPWGKRWGDVATF
jgi:hypothetical protein